MYFLSDCEKWNAEICRIEHGSTVDTVVKSSIMIYIVRSSKKHLFLKTDLHSFVCKSWRGI